MWFLGNLLVLSIFSISNPVECRVYDYSYSWNNAASQDFDEYLVDTMTLHDPAEWWNDIDSGRGNAVTKKLARTKTGIATQYAMLDALAHYSPALHLGEIYAGYLQKENYKPTNRNFGNDADFYYQDKNAFRFTPKGYNLNGGFSEFPIRKPTPPRKAVVNLVAGAQSVTGTLQLTTVSYPMPGVMIKGIINGLTPGKHGFHVHTDGELTNQCADAGGHFNPSGKSHGSPTDSHRHAGDLGNIVTPPTGPTYVNIFDHVIRLGDGSSTDVAGRAIVVHAGEDDLGRGEGDDEPGSIASGNAGARASCGKIIMTVEKKKKPRYPSYLTYYHPMY